jgi:hypothetical protein
MSRMTAPAAADILAASRQALDAAARQRGFVPNMYDGPVAIPKALNAWVDLRKAMTASLDASTRRGSPNNLVKVMTYCPRLVQLEVEYATSFMFDQVAFGDIQSIRPRPDGLMWRRSGRPRTC